MRHHVTQLRQIRLLGRTRRTVCLRQITRCYAELNKLFGKLNLCWCKFGYKAALSPCYWRMGSPPHLGANNDKEVNSVKKADKPSIVINIHISGDNNKVSLNETHSHSLAIVINVVITALIVVAVLAVSCCCPELLPDFVRWIIGRVVNS